MIWSVITGVIGILSFLLSLSDKFKEYKKYLNWTFIFFLGIFFGTISFSLTGFSKTVVSNPRLATGIIILAILMLFTGIIISFFINRKNDYYAYMVFIMAMIFFVPNIYKLIDERAFGKIDNLYDYIYLAEYYEEMDDFEKAIDYYKKYAEEINKTNIRKSVNEKIRVLESEWDESIMKPK